MYTRCPHCLTVFVVGAEQLKAAHGNVRCGTCFESFDAIPHLSDGPLQASGASGVEAPASGEERPDVPLAATGEEASPTPAPETPEAPETGVPEPETPEVPVTGVPEPIPDRAFDEAIARAGDPESGRTRSASERLSSTLDALRAGGTIVEDPARVDAPAADGEGDAPPVRAEEIHGLPRDEDDGIGPDSDPHQDDYDDTLPDASTLEGDPSLPEVLREGVDQIAARNAARRRNIGFGAAALGLVLLLVAQYLFFMPDDAIRRYPQWRGAIESMCVQFGCVLPEQRDPSRIRVISRDVRVHPRFEGVLQIKATLTNAAPYRQPYPRVRFTLFNVNGQTIATRVFRPSEYLGRSVAASARLRPDTPFQVELDVLAPEQAAVSFEFQFL